MEDLLGPIHHEVKILEKNTIKNKLKIQLFRRGAPNPWLH
jgi:hypothetical protein